MQSTSDFNDFNDLRYIALIHQTGSLAATAKLLGVNHATVYRRVNQLEERLGVRLFERDGGRYLATAAGEELARAGMQINDTAQQALLKVIGQDLRPSGLVRITTTDSIAHALLFPILRRCREKYPHIHISLSLDNQMYNLSKRDAEIALRPAMKPPEYLIGKCISSLGFGIFAQRAYWQSHNELALAEQDWIALDESSAQQISLRWLEKLLPLEKIGMRVSGFNGVFKACQSGLGLAILPCVLARSSPELQMIGEPLEDCASALWLLTHPDLRQTLRVKVVFQFLYEELLALREQIAGQL